LGGESAGNVRGHNSSGDERQSSARYCDDTGGDDNGSVRVGLPGKSITKSMWGHPSHVLA
jgi:hypothetical protein